MKEKQLSWALTNYKIICRYRNQTHIIDRKNILADQLLIAIRDQDYQNISLLLTTPLNQPDPQQNMSTEKESYYFNIECVYCGENCDNGSDVCEECEIQDVEYCEECGRDYCIDFECLDDAPCDGCGEYDCCNEDCINHYQSIK